MGWLSRQQQIPCVIPGLQMRLKPLASCNHPRREHRLKRREERPSGCAPMYCVQGCGCFLRRAALPSKDLPSNKCSIPNHPRLNLSDQAFATGKRLFSQGFLQDLRHLNTFRSLQYSGWISGSRDPEKPASPHSLRCTAIWWPSSARRTLSLLVLCVRLRSTHPVGCLLPNYFQLLSGIIELEV